MLKVPSWCMRVIPTTSPYLVKDFIYFKRELGKILEGLSETKGQRNNGNVNSTVEFVLKICCTYCMFSPFLKCSYM